MDFNISSSYTYNQKEILKNKVLSFVKEKNLKSILDIGAGFIETAVSYSGVVDNYLAIEKDPSKSESLKKAGLHVLNSAFPCGVQGVYDLVLSSHSIPEVMGDYEDFLKKAWELVAPEGYLMIITFKGVLDVSTEVRSILSDTQDTPYDSDKFKVMMDVLETFGKPELSTITSVERSQNSLDIATVACMFFEGNNDECISKAHSFVENKLKVGDIYEFPHNHNVIVIKKLKV